MSMPRIAIIDYGVGNIGSIMRALTRCGAAPFLTSDPEAIAHAHGVVLPGVGAFKTGMDGLTARGLVEPIRAVAQRGTPLLGICLGAQLLLTEGREFGTFAGLDLIPGTVDIFAPQEAGTKIPHIGWNTVAPPSVDAWNGTLLQETSPETHFYFVHSFVMQPTDASHVLTQTIYGGTTFASAVYAGRITGCQFHPEKSGPAGLALLTRFIAQCSV